MKLMFDEKDLVKINDVISDIINFTQKGILAGGAALAVYEKFYLGNHVDEIKDWDIFFSSFEDMKEAEDILLQKNYKLTAESYISKTYHKNGFDVQLIKHMYEDVYTLLNDFDIDVCMVAIHKGHLYVNHYYAIAKKVFKVLKVTPIILDRCNRYVQKGYKHHEDNLDRIREFPLEGRLY